eukprot:NODE_632_length_1313_cov_106.258853_g593_i0.p1 GENE.NODE_632_length_1313_cov_106.258853_g593_i0~~NODE_632_length_1313_cov_106.258853_g593_i0.p1  ORF type:complete len:377 (+),score=40.14 NODE_632_length_1313_cov_106.258853_g593_i0:171-1301(+)
MLKQVGVFLAAVALLAAVLMSTPVLRFMAPAIIDRVTARTVDSTFVRSDYPQRFPPESKDGMSVFLCGTGLPMLSKNKAGACTAILVNDNGKQRVYIVDTGPGSYLNFALSSISRNVTGVLYSHFHSDHIADLGEFITQSWIFSGNADPFDVFGPPGVEGLVDGFVQAYALDRKYRNKHHGDQALPMTGAIPKGTPITLLNDNPNAEVCQPTVVLDEEGLKVTAFPVDHGIVKPAYGYRFDFKGRSVVVSGDTNKSKTLIACAKNADIIVHEALEQSVVKAIHNHSQSVDQRVGHLLLDVLDYHASPAEAVESAEEANANLLIFSHIFPPLQNFLIERIFYTFLPSTSTNLRILLGHDGLAAVLPAHSDAIVTKWL